LERTSSKAGFAEFDSETIEVARVVERLREFPSDPLAEPKLPSPVRWTAVAITAAAFVPKFGHGEK